MKQKKKKIPVKTHRKRNIIISISVVILILTGFLILYTNKKSKETLKSNEYAKPYEPPFTKDGQLYFIKKSNKKTIKSIAIEIADDDKKRTQGLMWRRTMADSLGMLFIFENEQELSLWMKNTYIPLDIIYVNKSLEIVAIQENTTPHSEMQIPSFKPAQFVVEVNAGFCRNHGIENGDKIIFEKTNGH